jgi:hypothetical protein
MVGQRFGFGAVSFAASMVVGAGVALSAACISPRDFEAHAVYALRTQVLVGAQSCHMLDRFNVFAKRFGGELVAEGQILHGYYLRAYGKSGDSKLDDFVTGLSNASFVKGSEAGDFCGATAALFDSIDALPAGQLAAFSQRHAPPALPAMDVCGATRTAVAPQ